MLREPLCQEFGWDTVWTASFCSMFSKPQLAGSDSKGRGLKASTPRMASSFTCQAPGVKDRLSWNVRQSTPRWPLQPSSFGMVDLLHWGQGFNLKGTSEQGRELHSLLWSCLRSHIASFPLRSLAEAVPFKRRRHRSHFSVNGIINCLLPRLKTTVGPWSINRNSINFMHWSFIAWNIFF